MLAAHRYRIQLCLFAPSLILAAAAGLPPAWAQPDRPVILVVGDSLSAEYGLPRDTGWVSLLAQRLEQRSPQYSVVNASISGDTTSGGRSRLPQLLQATRPRVVVIELGGNDGLRGLDVGAMQANLQAMIDASRNARSSVLLVGIRIPPNYGREYTRRFDRCFEQLAHRNRVSFVPFLLEGIADHAEAFQADRIHPNQDAQARLLDNVWPRLQPLLQGPSLPAPED